MKRHWPIDPREPEETKIRARRTKNKLTSGQTALLILDTIIQMSDEAQKLGGATSISGVASLHKMQTSIQKNKARIIEAIRGEQ